MGYVDESFPGIVDYQNGSLLGDINFQKKFCRLAGAIGVSDINETIISK